MHFYFEIMLDTISDTTVFFHVDAAWHVFLRICLVSVLSMLPRL